MTVSPPLAQPAAAPTSGRIVLIVLIIAVASFMQMLDALIVTTAIPQMARSFGVSPIALGASITAYVMTTAMLIPTSGWLADRIGAKRLFIGALLAFTLASVLCGLSQSLMELVAARAAQGLGGAMLSPVGSVIMMKAIDRRDMVRMTNLFSAPVLLAPVIGPPLGGFITTYLGWPAIFYLNVPVGLAGAALSLMFLPSHPQVRRPFDVRGFGLSTLALGALIYGFGELGGDRPGVLAWLIVLTGSVAAVLAVRHMRRHSHPLLPMDAARFPTFSLTTLWALPFIRMPMAAVPFVLPILLQVGFGFSALVSGLVFLGHTLGDLLMKLATRPVFAGFGYRTVMLGAVVGYSVTVAGCALFTRQTPASVMVTLLFVGGCMRSCLGTGMGTLSYADIDPETMGHATTLNQVVMQLVQAISISLTMIALEIAVRARGGLAGQVSAADCRAALVIAGGVGLMALAPLARLAPDAGAELSGHRLRVRSV